eukprot:2791859-Pyramimonas_sp.AAC.1
MRLSSREGRMRMEHLSATLPRLWITIFSRYVWSYTHVRRSTTSRSTAIGTYIFVITPSLVGIRYLPAGGLELNDNLRHVRGGKAQPQLRGGDALHRRMEAEDEIRLAVAVHAPGEGERERAARLVLRLVRAVDDLE